MKNGFVFASVALTALLALVELPARFCHEPEPEARLLATCT